ncbi:WapI family immunity protein [Tautonia plasticadhaerens]|uniref:Uncharacterized protein n=1 Tax=Tautonia plasticadhaerens TaxID=2527974 RepID=A0A518GX80_9BACT|nr:hypothetical protein [Tautonia plasticadhaerens]QDV33190.1 hypothetical protein ElP_10320 [Tautonia plasticadhaerens]
MDHQPIEFLMGDRRGAHLLLRPAELDRPGESGDDWLVTEVVIAAGGFSGRFRAFLRAEELAGFRSRLATLHDELRGEAVLDCTDGWLRVAVSGDGRGGLVARCEATDDPAIDNRLRFVLLLDQSYLPGMIDGLDAILRRYPVAG